MPPFVALTICTAFILFLLWLDRKQYPEAPFALWVPTIWMLMTFSKPLAIWMQTTGESIEEGNPLDRVFLITLICIGLFILAKRRFNLARAVKENVWLILLILFMLVSCLWSDIPFISFKRWSKEFVAVIMAFVVASEANRRAALESMFRRIVYVLIPLSYLLINYYPEYGRIYVHHDGDLMWTGAAMHKNTLAQLCLFSAFFIIWMLVRRWHGRDIPVVRYQTIVDMLILAIAFWLWGGPYHSLTYSATATVAFVFGVCGLMIMSRKRKPGAPRGSVVYMAIIAIIIIYGTITPMIGKLTLVDVSAMLGRQETLTGRSEVWAEVVPAAMEKPILGYGFASFWSTESRNEYDISDAHNGYLDLILSVGVIGLILYSIFLLSSVRKAQNIMYDDYDWSGLWLCYLLMGVLINITESSFSSLTSKLMAVILMLTVSFSNRSYVSLDRPSRGTVRQ